MINAGNSDDIEILHSGGRTVVRGLERGRAREFKKQVNASPGLSGYLPFYGAVECYKLRTGTDEREQTVGVNQRVICSADTYLVEEPKWNK